MWCFLMIYLTKEFWEEEYVKITDSIRYLMLHKKNLGFREVKPLVVKLSIASSCHHRLRKRWSRSDQYRLVLANHIPYNCSALKNQLGDPQRALRVHPSKSSRVISWNPLPFTVQKFLNPQLWTFESYYFMDIAAILIKCELYSSDSFFLKVLRYLGTVPGTVLQSVLFFSLKNFPNKHIYIIMTTMARTGLGRTDYGSLDETGNYRFVTAQSMSSGI